ncbi:MAG: c-type cytochrome [Oxalobacteraceae bacterium]
MNHHSLTATLLGSAMLALALSTASTALAIDQQTLYTQSLAATCANCHGTQGKGVPEGSVPKLAGLTADYLEAQMKAFKSGERQATIMHQLAKGYSDEQLRALAAYFASQKP